MPWRELILHLDYPGFILPSPESLSLIMTAYNMACREPFPLECLHLAWTNPRGQVYTYMMKICSTYSVCMNDLHVHVLAGAYMYTFYNM